MSLESDYLAAINLGDTDAVLAAAAALDSADTADAAMRPPSTPNLPAAARWYAASGTPVFPCIPNGKRPLLPRAHRDPATQAACKGTCGADGHGLYDSSTDPAKIHTWWTQQPLANLGMPTGRQFDVIDVDGPTGVATMWGSRPIGPYACYYDSLNDPDGTVLGRVHTPRDGGHHLYLPPGMVRATNGAQIGPGLDYRGTGGYVLLPPSVITDYGGPRPYRWMVRPDFTVHSDAQGASGTRGGGQ